jgi:hypothetical protein
MGNNLLETIKIKKDSIRATAKEYFLLNKNKSNNMDSHCIKESDLDSEYDYVPIESFRKEIPYNNFEKIIPK